MTCNCTLKNFASKVVRRMTGHPRYLGPYVRPVVCRHGLNACHQSCWRVDGLVQKQLLFFEF